MKTSKTKGIHWLCTAVVLAITNTTCLLAVEVVTNQVVTNGIIISPEVQIDYPGEPCHISLKIQFRSPNTNAEASIWEYGGLSGIFYWATNSFCGPVELRDASGKKLRLLKPEVNDPAAYPPYYSLKAMHKHFARITNRGPSLPLVFSGSDCKMTISLSRYFNIEKPGEYQLTVWPIIYKRVFSTNDICQKITFSPITIPIKWDSK